MLRSILVSSGGSGGGYGVVPFVFKLETNERCGVLSVVTVAGIAEHLFLNKRSTEGVFVESLLKVLAVVYRRAGARPFVMTTQSDAVHFLINRTRAPERGRGWIECVCSLY